MTPIELSGNGLTLVLAVPEFNDSLDIEHFRINRQTRAGDRIIFRDPSWPRTETLRFQFNNLSQIQARQLLDFVNETLGQDVTLVDHDGIEWLGIIINPGMEVEQRRRADTDFCGGFEAELQFEGTRV